MADNNFFKIKAGANLAPTASPPTEKGSLTSDSATGNLQTHDGSTAQSVATDTNTLTVTNKTLSGASNTFSNIPNGATTATAANTNSAIVTRDGSGNFAAGTITASLSGNATTATTAGTVSGVVSADHGGTGVANNAAATLTRTGNHAVTLTTSNTTSVTLPTAGTLSTLAGTETFTNKTIGDATTYTQVVTPSNPSSGFDRLYFKSDDNLYKLSSAGIESQIGTGSGGLKNYLGTVNNVNGNGNFELGSTTGWSLSHSTLDSTTKLPNQASGSWTSAAGTLSFTAVTSGKLAGTYSGSLVSSGATTAGDMLVSQAFTLDTEDQAKALQYALYYSATSGVTNLNLSGTSSNSVGFAVYDVTNSVWIQPAGVFNFVQSSGVGKATGTFQTTSNSTSYRVAVYFPNASAGAATILVDDFFLGPQITTAGSAMDDWVSYTPTFTGFGTPASISMWSRRVGDSLQLQGKFTTGTVTATTAQMTLGYNGGNANVTIDTAKVPTIRLVGKGDANATSATDFGGKTLLGTGGNNFLNFSGEFSTATPLTAANANAVFGSTQLVSIFAEIPISGWSSNTVVSNDTDTRVVEAKYKASGTRTPTTVKSMNFDTLVYDNFAAVTTVSGDITGWKFTAPISGFYDIFLSYFVQTGSASSTNYVYVNGVQDTAMGSSVTSGTVACAATTVKLNAGDFCDIRTDATPTFGNASTLNQISISRRSGPATIAASSVIASRYTSASGQSIANSGTIIIDFATKTYDNTASVTTGASWKFTAPISGKFSFSGGITFTPSLYAVGNSIELYLYKNAALYATVNGNTIQAATSPGIYLPFTTDADALAGDTFDIRVTNNRTAGATALVNSSAYNHISISSLGGIVG